MSLNKLVIGFDENGMDETGEFGIIDLETGNINQKELDDYINNKFNWDLDIVAEGPCDVNDNEIIIYLRSGV